MLDYARQRAIEALNLPRRAFFVTSGPAGLLADEFPCQAAGLIVFLLVPGTSDHLFNLEHDPHVTLLATGWELKGEARVFTLGESDLELDLLREPGAEWCVLVVWLWGVWRCEATPDTPKKIIPAGMTDTPRSELN